VPSVRVTTNFLLVLTLFANAVVAFAVVLGIAALVSQRARDAVHALVDVFGPQSILLAWIVAIVTTAGSLYYSEHAGFIPCTLCWYQRILMYPLVIVLGVGWLRRDHQVWKTALPFVAIGAPLALYHWLVERVPWFASTSSCSLDVPCTSPWFEKLGFVTLAWMSMSSFLLIGTLLVCSIIFRRHADLEGVDAGDDVDDSDPADPADPGRRARARSSAAPVDTVVP
jgi:disulfide bond formation protein DsbB